MTVAFPEQSTAGGAKRCERRPEKARIHTGGAPGLQPRRPVNHARAADGPQAANAKHGRPGRGRALLGARRRMVGPARQDGAAAQVQSGAHRLHPRPGRRPLRPRSQAARFAEGACASSTSAAAAASCPSRWPGSAPPWSASIRRRPISRRRSSTPAQRELPIDYRCTTAEELAETGERFDVVLAMEVVEHVADVPLFVQSCADDGEARRADDRRHLNRTLKSFALAIVGAEYILRWLPVGTHRWDKFVTPNELEIAMEQGGLARVARAGRDLQHPCRPLAALDRYRRELHARGGEGLGDRCKLALGRVHAAGRRRPDRAQRHAARAHRRARHRRRHPCALPVRVSVRADFPRRRADRDRPAAARAAGRCSGPGCCSAPARRFSPPR